MSLFTTHTPKSLDEARKHVVPSEVHCTSCRSSFRTEPALLSAANPTLHIEAYACPHCGHLMLRRACST